MTIKYRLISSLSPFPGLEWSQLKVDQVHDPMTWPSDTSYHNTGGGCGLYMHWSLVHSLETVLPARCRSSSTLTVVLNQCHNKFILNIAYIERIQKYMCWGWNPIRCTESWGILNEVCPGEINLWPTPLTQPTLATDLASVGWGVC